MLGGQRSPVFTSHTTRTDRGTCRDVDLNGNLHDSSFNLHVKLHGNLITVDLSTEA